VIGKKRRTLVEDRSAAHAKGLLATGAVGSNDRGILRKDVEGAASLIRAVELEIKHGFVGWWGREKEEKEKESWNKRTLGFDSSSRLALCNDIREKEGGLRSGTDETNVAREKGIDLPILASSRNPGLSPTSHHLPRNLPYTWGMIRRKGRTLELSQSKGSEGEIEEEQTHLWTFDRENDSLTRLRSCKLTLEIGCEASEAV
jgi:hypothetical protein